MKSRTGILLLVFIFLISFAAGCNKDNNEDSTTTGKPGGTTTTEAEDPDAAMEKVKISVGLKNLPPSEDDKYWPCDFALKVMEDMNIELEFTSYDEDTMSIALASGDLDDIMMAYKSDFDSVLTAGYAEPLDGYLDQYGSRIKQYEPRNNFLKEYCSDDTGQLYFLTPQTGILGDKIPDEEIYVGQDFVYGHVVRWDLYKEAGYPEIMTDDDFYNFLKETVERHPTTENGDKMYAMAIDNEINIWGWMTRSQSSWFGYQVLDYNRIQYLQDTNNDLVNDFL